MRRTLLTLVLATLAVVQICAVPARADDTQPTTRATSEAAPDKSRYTLFNPTPEDQLRDMDTDRPNKTNTPHTVDAGHLQIETGFFDYAYYRDQYQGANMRMEALDLGQFNFRVGVLDNLEINAVVNSFDLYRDSDFRANQSIRQNGFGDMVVGGKLNFWGNDGADDTWDASLGIQPQFKIPTAREEIGNGHQELFVGFPFLMNLPEDSHLGLQSTVSWERSTDNTNYVTGWQNSVSVDRVFFGKFDIFCEYWAHVSTQRHQEAQETIDVGFTYPLFDNVMLDTSLDAGLNRASTTFEWLSGVSIRF